MHPNEALLRKGYEAFANVDLETIQGLFTDDVVWHVPGRNPLSGIYKGRDDVLGLLGEIVTRTDGTFKTELHDVVANDEHAVAITVTTAEREGKQLRSQGMTLYHVRDGKVSEAWTIPGDLYSEDEFWS